MPRDGCPGPTLRPIVLAGKDGAHGISAIVFDVDPWHFGTEAIGKCSGNNTPEELGEEIGRLVREHADEWLIVASHHPLRTYGRMAGSPEVPSEIS